jgi:hypothetical protein
VGRGVLAGCTEVETLHVAAGGREGVGGLEALGALDPVAHVRLLGVAVVGAAQYVVEEGERLALPGVDRQVVGRRGEDEPLAVRGRPCVGDQVVAAELVQVEVAEVLYDRERHLDVAERGGRALGDRRLRAGLLVEHPVRVDPPHELHGRGVLEGLEHPRDPAVDQPLELGVQRSVGEVADERAAIR